jgi:hypothetical protein
VKERIEMQQQAKSEKTTTKIIQIDAQSASKIERQSKLHHSLIPLAHRILALFCTLTHTAFAIDMC